MKATAGPPERVRTTPRPRRRPGKSRAEPDAGDPPAGLSSATSRRCCARSCWSSCARSSRCRACRCSRSPRSWSSTSRCNRNSVEGDLAAGILWVTLLFAAMLGVNRLFVADADQGGFDALPAGARRPQRAAARQGARAARDYLVVLELVAVPAFALLLLGTVARPRAARACWWCSRSATSAWR